MKIHSSEIDQLASRDILESKGSLYHILVYLALLLLLCSSCSADADSAVSQEAATQDSNETLFWDIFQDVQEQQLVNGISAFYGAFLEPVGKDTYAALFVDGTMPTVVLPDGTQLFFPRTPMDPLAPLIPCDRSGARLLRSQIIRPDLTEVHSQYDPNQLILALDDPNGDFPGMLDKADFTDLTACVFPPKK